MRSRKKNKEPEKTEEAQPFFGKQAKENSFFQKKEGGGKKEKEKEKEKEKDVQAKSENSTSAKSGDGHTASGLGDSAGKGQSLPSGARSQMETAFGSDFNEVNIHTDEEAAEMSHELGAQAFTYGQDIYFNKGKFKPGTEEGDGLLAHELAHTLQQQGETTEGKHFDEGAEMEADTAAKEFLQHRGVKNLKDPDKEKRVRKPKGGKKLSLQRCPEKPDTTGTVAQGSAKDATADGGSGDAAADPLAAMRTDVGNVKSLNLEDYKGRLTTSIAALNTRFKRRNDHLAEKSPLVKGDQKTIVEGMIKKGTDWATRPFSDWTTAEIDTVITQEKAAKAQLKRNENTDSVIDNFIASLENVKTLKTQISEEEVEYKRFDAQFMDPQVVTLCAGIPHATITPADIKALISKESGDMTNTAIAGLETKKKGITTNDANQNFVGMAQIGTDAQTGGLDWAKKAGSPIAVDPAKDPRKDPATAIKLAAAFLGETSRLLWGALPANKPGPVEFKKMLLASYNGGHQTIANAANDFTKGKIKDYTWDQIKNLLRWNGSKKDPKTEEIRTFVTGIEARLPAKP